MFSCQGGFDHQLQADTRSYLDLCVQNQLKEPPEFNPTQDYHDQLEDQHSNQGRSVCRGEQP